MKIIVRYLKRGKDDRDIIRTGYLHFAATQYGPINWSLAVNLALANLEAGERIVRISEPGYHD